MGVVGHVAHVGEMRNLCKIWLENLKERDHPDKLGIDGNVLSE